MVTPKRTQTHRVTEMSHSGARTNLLKDLYNRDITYNVRFWRQDDSGVPVAIIERDHPDDVTRHVNYVQNHLFRAAEWASARKPDYWIGSWPPTSIANMVGLVKEWEPCILCGKVAAFTCDGSQWKEDLQNVWIHNIRISDERDGKGLVLFARHNIDKTTVVGEYIGGLLPKKKDRSDDECLYMLEIPIGDVPLYPALSGHLAGKPRVKRSRCEIDASRSGSVMQFINHSCNPNIETEEGRIGMDRRSIAFRAVKKVYRGQELTHDYGDAYFKEGEHCLCGASNCRRLPPSKGESSKKGTSRKDDTSKRTTTPKSTALRKSGHPEREPYPIANHIRKRVHNRRSNTNINHKKNQNIPPKPQSNNKNLLPPTKSSPSCYYDPTHQIRRPSN